MFACQTDKVMNYFDRKMNVIGRTPDILLFSPMMGGTSIPPQCEPWASYASFLRFCGSFSFSVMAAPACFTLAGGVRCVRFSQRY